jgi:hypothetical protein
MVTIPRCWTIQPNIAGWHVQATRLYRIGDRVNASHRLTGGAATLDIRVLRDRDSFDISGTVGPFSAGADPTPKITPSGASATERVLALVRAAIQPRREGSRWTARLAANREGIFTTSFDATRNDVGANLAPLTACGAAFARIGTTLVPDAGVSVRATHSDAGLIIGTAIPRQTHVARRTATVVTNHVARTSADAVVAGKAIAAGRRASLSGIAISLLFLLLSLLPIAESDVGRQVHTKAG